MTTKSAPKKTMFHIIENPLLTHKLTHMRRNYEDCPSRMFVSLMREAGMIMAIEIFKLLYKSNRKKKFTDFNDEEFEGELLELKKPVIVAVLRSGLIMADGMQHIISTNFAGHIGIYNDDSNEGAIKYLSALPDKQPDRYFFLVDPVISSGATACLAIQTLKDFGILPDKIKFISLIVGEKGEKRLATEHNDVAVYCVKVGEEMRGRVIRHGLGNVSERQFRTI